MNIQSQNPQQYIPQVQNIQQQEIDNSFGFQFFTQQLNVLPHPQNKKIKILQHNLDSPSRQNYSPTNVKKQVQKRRKGILVKKEDDQEDSQYIDLNKKQIVKKQLDDNQNGQYRLMLDNIQKQHFDNTLTGYVLKTFEIHNQVPLTESYVVEQVRAQMHKLKRPDGTKYKGNIYKTVKGSLTSNGIFQKVHYLDQEEPQWIVNKEAACEFRERTCQRFRHLADRRKIIKKQKILRQIAQENSPLLYECNENQFCESHSSYQVVQPVIENKYRHVYSLLDGFYNSQKDNSHIKQILDQTKHIQIANDKDFNEFQKLIPNYEFNEVLEGIIQAYIFFQEVIQMKLKEEQGSPISLQLMRIKF